MGNIGAVELVEQDVSPDHLLLARRLQLLKRSRQHHRHNKKPKSPEDNHSRSSKQKRKPLSLMIKEHMTQDANNEGAATAAIIAPSEDVRSQSVTTITSEKHPSEHKWKKKAKKTKDGTANYFPTIQTSDAWELSTYTRQVVTYVMEMLPKKQRDNVKKDDGGAELVRSKDTAVSTSSPVGTTVGSVDSRGSSPPMQKTLSNTSLPLDKAAYSQQPRGASMYDVPTNMSKLFNQLSGVQGAGYAPSVKIIGADNKEIASTDIVTAPDGGWGWLVVFGSFYSNLILGGIVFSFSFEAEALIVSLSEAGGNDANPSPVSQLETEVNLISGLLSGFYLMGGPLGSALANKFGFRMVAILGSVLASVGFLAAYIICRTTPNLYALWGLMGVVGGLGFSLIYIPSVIAVGFYFEKKRALATGLSMSGTGVGQFAFAPLTLFLVQSYGWKVTTVVQAGLILSCGAAGSLYRVLRPAPVKDYGDDEDDLQGDYLLQTIKKGQGAVPVRQRSGGSLLKISQSMPDMTDSPLLTEGQQRSQPTTILYDQIDGEWGSSQWEDDFDKGYGYGIGSDSHINTQSSFGGVRIGSGTRVTEARLGHSVYRIDSALGTREMHVASNVDLKTINQPLFRDDIFYGGSMMRLPAYAETVATGYTSSPEWSAMVTKKPNNLETEGFTFPRREKSQETHKCSARCYQGSAVLIKLLSFKLLSSPTFFLLVLSNVFTYLGYLPPFMLLRGLVVQNGLKSSDASVFFQVIGGCNTMGRIICGLVADSPRVNVNFVFALSLTTMGVSVAVLPFLREYWMYLVYCVVFGTALAFYVSLITIQIVELLGLDNLTNAFGLLSLIQGAALTIGPIIASSLKESSGNYDLSFYTTGGFIVLSAVVLYPVGCVNRWEKRRKGKTN